MIPVVLKAIPVLRSRQTPRKPQSESLVQSEETARVGKRARAYLKVPQGTEQSPPGAERSDGSEKLLKDSFVVCGSTLQLTRWSRTKREPRTGPRNLVGSRGLFSDCLLLFSKFQKIPEGLVTLQSYLTRRYQKLQFGVVTACLYSLFCDTAVSAVRLVLVPVFLLSDSAIDITYPLHCLREPSVLQLQYYCCLQHVDIRSTAW